MAKLSERQIKELDIDWYCLVDGRPTHIASMGGIIPLQFRNRTELRNLQDMIASMPAFTEARLNIDNIESQIADGYDYLKDKMIGEAVESANKNHPGYVYLSNYKLPIRLYASSFVEKARRGFYSYAKKDGTNENEYILIAKPDTPCKYDDFGLQLKQLECLQSDGGTVMIINE